MGPETTLTRHAYANREDAKRAAAEKAVVNFGLAVERTKTRIKQVKAEHEYFCGELKAAKARLKALG